MHPPTPTRRRSWLTRVATWGAWGLGWLGLTAAGTALHWGAWIAPAENPPIPTILGAGVFKQLANFMAIPAAPGWILVSKAGSGLFGLNLWVTGHSINAALIANGFGWACMLGFVWVVLRIRGMLLRRPRAVSSDESKAAPESGIDLSRRRLILNSAVAGVGFAGSGSVAYGSTVEPWDLRLVRYRVPIKDLPAKLEGFRIMQVTDTHLGPRVPAEHVHNAMRMALESTPDLLCLTGDYVHNGFYQVAPAAELFSKYIYSYIPVVGVLGNHDWYAGGKAMSQAMSRLGIRMIDNGRVYFDPETRSLRDDPTPDCLCLAGVGDLQQDHVDFEAALGGVPEGTPRVLLAHNPDSAEEPGVLDAQGKPRRVDLMLSGHTHGGQVRLPLIGAPIVPSRFGSKYAHGLNQGPTCRVLTSAGVGLSLVPLRIGVPPEVVEITLVRS